RRSRWATWHRPRLRRTSSGCNSPRYPRCDGVDSQGAVDAHADATRRPRGAFDAKTSDERPAHLIEAVQDLVRRIDVERAEVFLELGDGSGACDRAAHGGTADQPGQGQLGRRTVDLGREGADVFGQPEAWVAEAPGKLRLGQGTRSLGWFLPPPILAG